MDPRPHVVFTNGRSGSNYVASLLNAHPNVTNYGEVLAEHHKGLQLHRRFGLWGRDIESYLDTVFESQSHFWLAQAYSAFQHIRRGQRPRWKRWSTTLSVGFKEFGIRFERLGLDRYLEQRPQIRVVSLVRENTFDRVVSVHRLAQTGEVAAGCARGTTRAITIPVETMLRDLAVYEDEKAYQLGLVARLPAERVLRTTYEDLFRSTCSQEAFRAALFDFLEVPEARVETSHRKLAVGPIEDRLANYPAIREAVSGTAFAAYLPS